MADISGPGGNFTSISGFNAHFSGWNVVDNVTNVENTGFSENGNRTYLPTAQVFTGSAAGTGIQSSSIFPTGIQGSTPTMSTYTGTITLTNWSGGTCSFNANIQAIAVGRQFDGKADVAISFTSSGPITGSLA